MPVQCLKLDGTDVKTDIDQLNRVESSEMNPPIHGQMIFSKSAKIEKWGKDNLFKK